MITRYPYPTVDTNGHLDVVQHAHPDSVYVHFDYAFTGGTSLDFILIDLSDTTNYHHTNTGYIHLEELFINVDADTNASYQVTVGWLENVDATDGDLYEITHLYGTKAVGQQKEIIRKFYPNGPKCSSSYAVTSDITLNDTAFQTDVNMRTTLDPTTADTPSGSGDLILRVNAGAGGANTDFNVEVNLSFHSHA